MTRLSLLLICLLAIGCAAKPLTGSQTYQDGGMSFSVPAGWKVTLSGKNGGCGRAFIEAPGEAVVFIKGVPLAKDPGLTAQAREFSRTANGSTPLGKITGDGFRTFPDNRYGTGLTESFSITFLGTKVPHTRHYRRLAGSHCAFYVLTQVADEDAAAAEAGFREILNSFSVR
jgi:hypothetical protein